MLSKPIPPWVSHHCLEQSGLHFHHLLMAAAKSFFFALIYFYTTHQITQYCRGPMAKPQSTKIPEKNPPDNKTWSCLLRVTWHLGWL